MKSSSTWKIAFSTMLLAVLMLAGSTAFAKVAPPPCTWIGNCPVAFCSSSSDGSFVRRCSEWEPCTDCQRDCDVRLVDGAQCKTNCDYF